MKIDDLKDAFRALTMQKFLKIARFESPAGFLLLLLPVLWSIVLGAKDLWIALTYLPIFILGAFVMRSAGCIINDMVDAQIDAEVVRTMHRPLASGEMSKNEALIALFILLFIAFCLMLTLSMKAILIAVLSPIAIFIYPHMKRFIQYPQIFLGLVFNLGVLIAWYTVCDPDRANMYVPFLIYIAAILWTVGYDTVYALQDKVDDEKISVFSSAVAQGDAVSEFVWNCYKIALLVLGVVGLNSYMNMLYYFLLALFAYQLNWQIKTLNKDDPKDCKLKFESNIPAGALFLLGCFLGKI